ncbi:MAG: trimeric intracellular cation channel family protein [Urechidicola sp.]|nr:trimeric intracellular cation channel family protein [Urechidicola sp.]
MFDLLDFIGTGVFAISGALAAMRQKFDSFGVLILASVTAIGGGSLRDVLIGNTPVSWMIHWEYLIVIVGATAIAMLFRKRLAYFRKTMFLFDAIGLGIFTIIGFEIGLKSGLHPIICVLLGTMSASFGGVLRDVLSNEVPLIFHKEVYASLSILGAITFYVLLQTSLPIEINYVVTSALVVVLRILAVKYEWEFPKLYKEN